MYWNFRWEAECAIIMESWYERRDGCAVGYDEDVGLWIARGTFLPDRLDELGPPGENTSDELCVSLGGIVEISQSLSSLDSCEPL